MEAWPRGLRIFMLSVMDVIARLEKLHPGFKVYGPYADPTGRKRVVFRERKGHVVQKNGRSFSMAWARAKIAALLERLLGPDEEVDHRNTNFADDSWDNLQLLSLSDHRKKSGIENSLRQDKRPVAICPHCLNPFLCEVYRLAIAQNKGKEPCCSRKCAIRLYGGRNQYTEA